MGKTVVSWSPVHGQGATTSNVAALAAHYSLTNRNHSLITHTQLNFSSLELLFGKEKTKSKGFEDSGMVALERLAVSKLLKPEAINDYTEAIYANRLDLLGGTQDQALENQKLLEVLLRTTGDAYDVVWIDAHSGTRNEITQKLLKSADLILVNLPQNRFVLDRFFNGDDFPKELEGQNIVILISQYDEDISFNIRKIKRKYKTKYPIYPIYYSRQFKEASNQWNISEMFYRINTSNKDMITKNFVDSLTAVNKLIARKLELNTNEGEEE